MAYKMIIILIGFSFSNYIWYINFCFIMIHCRLIIFYDIDIIACSTKCTEYIQVCAWETKWIKTSKERLMWGRFRLSVIVNHLRTYWRKPNNSTRIISANRGRGYVELSLNIYTMPIFKSERLYASLYLIYKIFWRSPYKYGLYDDY